MGDEMKPKQIIFTHIIFVSILVMIFLFFLDVRLPKDEVTMILFLIILPLIYIMLGFCMKEDLSVKDRLFIFSELVILD
jgi:hypothetical protein